MNPAGAAPFEPESTMTERRQVIDCPETVLDPLEGGDESSRCETTVRQARIGVLGAVGEHRSPLFKALACLGTYLRVLDRVTAVD